MSDKISPENRFAKNVRLHLFLSIIAFIELSIACFLVLSLAPDPKNAWLLGYSKLRWGLVLVSLMIALGLLVSGIIVYRKKLTFYGIIEQKVPPLGRKLLAFFTLILILWGWCSIFCPSYLFGTAGSYYERIQPISIAFGLILFQFYLLALFSKRKINFRSLKSIVKEESILRSSIFFTACLIVISAFIGITKIGLIKNTPYWNVPGIPLSGLQYLAVILVLSLGMYFLPTASQISSRSRWAKLYKFIPLAIYIGAVLLWGLTPMLKHYFSLEPTPPNSQPFPYSDARIYDSASISILNGQSGVFHTSTDKPLYIVFLTILHLFAGFNYSLLVWLQILALALIPVILYLLGKQFLNRAFGLFLALVVIIRQRNAIVLSYLIASVNPKLLVTEMMVLLGVVLLVFLVIKWLQTRKYWLALLSGGVVGALSLIRLNPILLFPTVAIVSLISLWKFPKIKWKHVVVFTLGFLILFTPWLFTGVHPSTGIPWALEKPISVISSRYLVKPATPAAPESTPLTVTLTPVSPTAIPKVVTSTAKPKPSSTAVAAHQVTAASTPKPHTPKTRKPIGLLATLKRITKANMASLQSQTADETKNSFPDIVISHFLHNFSTSLLSLPDSFVYDDLSHLAQRDYWIDFNPWSGNLPLGQILLILLNLVLVGVGLGFSWQKYHWVGLVPLAVFIGYDISLSLAATSGSRYIVPIDWVFYFYAGLAIVILLGKGIHFIRGEESPAADLVEDIPIQPDKDRKHFWLAFTGLVIAASLIPLANLGIKTPYSPREPAQTVNAHIQTIAADEGKNAKVTYGEILYPYYTKDGSLDFDFMVGQKSTHYLIDLTQNPLTVTLNGGETAILVSHLEDDQVAVDSLYLENENATTLIWKSSPEN